MQNPSICLNDPELKQASAAMNQLGLPKVASGAFASVYEFKNDDHQWAVRCFIRKPDDVHTRYKAISQFVLSDNLSYTVDFNYQLKGIRVNADWFPILKMNWAEGKPLDAYIREHLNEPETLKTFRQEFRYMMEQLRSNGIAHGDLQHGNILVDEGEIYLVDYDGMYVPELAGFKSNELGHRNYQHPKRSAQHFGPYLDNFSAWLIDLSLHCLIEDPSLWQQFSAGDECLLFKASDLAAPDEGESIKIEGSLVKQPQSQ